MRRRCIRSTVFLSPANSASHLLLRASLTDAHRPTVAPRHRALQRSAVGLYGSNVRAFS